MHGDASWIQQEIDASTALMSLLTIA